MGSPIGNPIARSLRASKIEVIPTNIMLVILDYYLVPYALFLGASAKEVGLLVAIPHLLGSFAQILASNSVRWFGSRLKLMIQGSALQVCLFLPVALLFLFPQTYRIPLLIGCACALRIFMNLVGTAWGSLMSEYLVAEERGHYFGTRSRIGHIASLGGLFLAGVLLYLVKKVSFGSGFFLLFISAAACRFLSVLLFRKMADLPYHERPESRFTFPMFLGRFRESNFVKYVLYASAITFATQFAAPYFSVYMLDVLGWSYLQYTVIHVMSVVSGLVSFPLWGRHADHVGNAKVLKLTSLLIPFIPLLWVVSQNFYYLMFAEAFSGFVWAGFTLCASNFVLDAVTPEKRVRCLGYFSVFSGVAIFTGAALGGYAVAYLPSFLGSPYLVLFTISALLRLAAHFLLSGRFHEVRVAVRPVNSLALFFSVLGIRPVLGNSKRVEL
jgi:MFS family permease